MKLNNKGMSLMELLVSIVLVGLVLTFLFQLLIDVKDETENNDYAYNNQVNRTETIYTIEKDLNKYILRAVENNSTNDTIDLNFIYTKEGKEVKSTFKSLKDNNQYYFTYKSVDGTDYKWEMKNAIIGCYKFNSYIDSTSDNYYFKLDINIYNSVYNEKNNKDKNNFIDDLEISYAGNKSDLYTTNANYLTSKTTNINTCTN